MPKLLIEIILVILLYITVCYPKWKKNKGKLFLNTLLYIYLYIIFATTFLPALGDMLGGGQGVFGSVNINLIPFRDALNQVRFYEREIAINVIVFIPFGIFLGLKNINKFYSAMIYSFLLSLFIETMQAVMTYLGVFTRTSDVTDLITNTIGGLIGYLIYRLLKYLFSAIFK